MGKFQGCTVRVVICMLLACLVQAYTNPVAEVRSMQVAQVVETTSTCDFEYGFCGWTQGEDDDFDWVIYGGRPAKINTGPVFDHTDGSGRNYMLMNASDRDEGETAVLISPEYPAVPAAGRCMVFYYHMHGRTMGTLRIYQISTDGVRSVVFQRDGDQGMDFRGDDEGWHKGRINLVSSTPYRLVIEGTVGWAARSYIALDDLTLTSTTCPNMPASCGTSQSEIRTRRILNGEASLPRQWPWQVLIKIYHATTGKTNQCGGTLIAPQWVLTAAHCIEDISNSLWITNRESITLSFEMNQGEWEQKEFTVHPVEILIHEERQVAANGMGPHDLLLLKLPYALTLDENVNVACLPAATDTTYPGTPCVVSGYGRQHYQGHSSLRLQHAYVNILNDSTCSGYHGDDLYSEDNICAGSASDIAIDACAGDSGGPLVCLWDDQYVLTGVVSFGSKCGFRPYPTPGVYANVAYYRDWIDEHIQV